MTLTRRQRMEQMLEKNPADPFLLYGVALECVREGEVAAGLERLRALAASHPDYDATFFQLGQILAQEGEPEEARAWLEKGVAAAGRNGNAKAVREMSEFMDTL
ncbi:MAG TPA: tetratricopeptide repeat protein [Planctomycetia bacterium]|nr:tetratricopeptide repeat protein [Planctomycetia bacterium]